MNEAAEVLVIFLSVFLAISLVLSIILLSLLIKLSKSLQRIADKAESAASNIGSVASAFKTAAGPLAIGKFLVTIAESVMSKKKGKG